MTEQRPSIGRIVHHRPIAGCQAAIITAVHDDGSVHLAVFRADGAIIPYTFVALGDEPGTWHWPERV